MISFTGLSEKNIDDICEIESCSLDTPWGKNELLKELENKNAHYVCVECDNKIAGYIGVWNICGEGNITNIAVHPDFRNKGLGTLLIKEMIKYAKDEKFLFLTLEVSEKNIQAYNLYKKCGFYETGKRKKYYHNKYDAILMEYKIED